jgi:hypothetical protein
MNSLGLLPTGPEDEFMDRITDFRRVVIEERVVMPRKLKKLRRPYGEGFALRTSSRDLLWKSKEEPDPWGSLVTEVVWNEFSTRPSIT